MGSTVKDWTPSKPAHCGIGAAQDPLQFNRKSSPRFPNALGRRCAYALAVGLRKNVTIGLSPEEFLRVQGAAAVAGVPVTTYLKWLLRGGMAGDGMGRQMTAVLEGLDAISIAVARLSSTPEARPALPAQGHLVAQRDVITTRLGARGVPSSTIRQVDAVLDELEAGR